MSDLAPIKVTYLRTEGVKDAPLNADLSVTSKIVEWLIRVDSGTYGLRFDTTWIPIHTTHIEFDATAIAAQFDRLRGELESAKAERDALIMLCGDAGIDVREALDLEEDAD